MTRKSILGIIPARGGSKGVPGKNIRKLAGKPLLYYVTEQAKRSRYVDRLILSTDSEDIAAVGRSLGLDVPFLRPTELSTDTASSISVVAHALAWSESHGGAPDAVLSVQPTNPFLTAASIDRAVQLWLDTNCDSVTTVAASKHSHPYVTKRLHADHRIEPFTPEPGGPPLGGHSRQTRETAYYMTGGLYLRTASLVREETRDRHHLGSDARAIVVDEREAWDINTEFDFEIAEALMDGTRTRQ